MSALILQTTYSYILYPQCGVEERLDVPVLEQVVDHSDGSDKPKHHRNKHHQPPHHADVGQTLVARDDRITQCDLALVHRLVAFLIPAKNGL